MTAGRGIIHSEMPKVTTGDLWGFQLWINLPKASKMVKPRWAAPLLTAAPSDDPCKHASWHASRTDLHQTQT